MLDQAKWGFSVTTIVTETGDGINDIVKEPFSYVTKSGEVITIPAGSPTDGASIPRILWWALPPFGVYWLPAVLHDYLYRETLKCRAACDAILLEAMQFRQVPEWKKFLIYRGVRIGGWWSFNQDRKAVTK